MYQHATGGKTNQILRERIAEIKAAGLKLIYEKWVESNDEDFCCWMQIYLIDYLGPETLCNMTRGGNGVGELTDPWEEQMLKDCKEVIILPVPRRLLRDQFGQLYWSQPTKRKKVRRDSPFYKKPLTEKMTMEELRQLSIDKGGLVRVRMGGLEMRVCIQPASEIDQKPTLPGCLDRRSAIESPSVMGGRRKQQESKEILERRAAIAEELRRAWRRCMEPRTVRIKPPTSEKADPKLEHSL